MQTLFLSHQENKRCVDTENRHRITVLLRMLIDSQRGTGGP